MPTEFQKVFTIQLPIYVRKKKNGVYEARFRKFGYEIAVSSSDYDELKEKFSAYLKLRKPAPRSVSVEGSKRSSVFSDVARRWLELKAPTIKENTFHFYEGLFSANIFPVFGGLDVSEIHQSDVQALINTYVEQEKMRTATKIFQTLKSIFDCAVGDELLDRSPMRMLRPPKYEEHNGSALTYEEERDFIARLHGSKCREEIKNSLLVLLYTGMRRSELAGVQRDGDFLSVICSKGRKGFREKRRLIPVTPMLAPLLPGIDLEALRSVRPDALTQAMKRLMPRHHLHELRHTFITRCQECGVSREVVSVWAGHAADNTQTSKVYTHFSREFLQNEAKKVIYQ